MKDPGKTINVVFFGRFNESEILSGPEKTARRLFERYSRYSKGTFIQYFFDGREHSAWQKLFGKLKMPSANDSNVYTMGLFRIYAFLLKEKPGIIHLAAFERFAVILYLYKMFNNVKIIYNSHGLITHENAVVKKVSYFKRLKDRFAEKIFLKYSDKIIMPSEMVLDLAEVYYNLNEKKVVFLPNGIDSEFAETTRSERINTQMKAVVILKNEFSRSGAKFLSDWLEAERGDIMFQLYIIGSPQIVDLQDFPNITLVEQMRPQELTLFYSDKDIFLQLNDYETFSIAAAEAMASGLIPVVTKNTGLSRYIDSGSNGYIVEYGNISELDAVICKIKEAAPRERSLILVNARKIYNELNWNAVYEMYSNVYKELAV